MKPIRLISLDANTEAVLHSDPAFQQAMAIEDWAGLAALMQRVIGPLAERSAFDTDDAPRWGGYAAVDAETGRVVGSCAFKGPPTPTGAPGVDRSEGGQVEIAYLTYPAFEGRGYATAMAAALIDRAGRAAPAPRVIAHTLPETNASTRVLEKAGFTRVGDVTDPNDGRVWRWEKCIGA